MNIEMPLPIYPSNEDSKLRNMSAEERLAEADREFVAWRFTED